MTRDEFLKWMKRCNLNKSSAARIFQVPRRTLQRWVVKTRVSPIIALACKAIEADINEEQLRRIKTATAVKVSGKEPKPYRPFISLRSKCSREKRDKARNLRRNATPAEVYLWQEVLSRKKLGVRARRQVIIRGYIVDFYVPSWGLVIEVDGGYHETPEQSAKDRQRTAIIEGLGFRVIRFTNAQVMMGAKTLRPKIMAMKRDFKLARQSIHVS